MKKPEKFKDGDIVEIDVDVRDSGKYPPGRFIGVVVLREGTSDRYLRINWVAGGPTYRNVLPGHDYIATREQVVAKLGEIKR